MYLFYALIHSEKF
ncbi:potassium-transporting ATPase subunit F [Staphylococcus argenteus]|nr:potassium-transporting ATPase subunit F [Staphylococcus argenteus]